MTNALLDLHMRSIIHLAMARVKSPFLLVMHHVSHLVGIILVPLSSCMCFSSQIIHGQSILPLLIFVMLSSPTSSLVLAPPSLLHVELPYCHNHLGFSCLSHYFWCGHSSTFRVDCLTNFHQCHALFPTKVRTFTCHQYEFVVLIAELALLSFIASLFVSALVLITFNQSINPCS